MENNKNEFKPYIPADRVVPEFTATSLLIGILLAIVFGGEMNEDWSVMMQ